jgi:hypothetical protein
MTLVWATKCGRCKKDFAVRPSKSAGAQLDMRTPSEKIKSQCYHCGHWNDLLGSDLEEVDSSTLPSPPPKDKK